MASIGTIIVRVFTSRAELPIQGALVTFTRKWYGTNVVLAQRVTDTSGKTAPVPLSTPSLADSTHPSDLASFALCDVWVEHEGYQRFLAEDVQVFPGVQTVQKVELIPLPEHGSPQDGRMVVVPPQDL